MRLVPTFDSLETLWSSSRCWLLKNVVLPVGDRWFGQKMIRRLRFLEEAQWWDKDRLYRYRDACLKKVISIAYYQVPFYRDMMDKAHVKPEDIASPSDLHTLPVVTKDMIRPAYPELITRKTEQRTYEVRTSGSTGKNFCVREDPETAGWYRATLMLTLGWAGWRIGEPHVQTGMTLERDMYRWLKDRVLGCHYVSAYDLTDVHLESTLDLLERYQIKHLWGYPGSLFFLARKAVEKGWNRSLSSIVTWGDNLCQRYRQTIEAAFGTRVIDTYGCAEGTHMAGQCGHGQNYHIYNLDVILEFLDDQGNNVSHEDPGNIVFTRLHAGPMPLIRYKVGDIGILGQRRNCSCGRGFDIMESVQGRDTDIVLTPSGNRLIVHFFTGILEHFSEIDSFQVVQEDIKAITLRVVPTKQFSKTAIDRIVSALRARGASDLEINVELVKEIPLSPAGKRRFVLSKLGSSLKL